MTREDAMEAAQKLLENLVHYPTSRRSSQCREQDIAYVARVLLRDSAALESIGLHENIHKDLFPTRNSNAPGRTGFDR